MHHLKLAAIAISVALGLSSAAAQDGEVVFILDGSNSMWGQVDGKAKIEIAQDVLSDVLADLPASAEIGFVAYGHRSTDDCGDIEMVLTPGQHTPAAIQSAIRSIQPKGKTPIAGALEFVQNRLSSNTSATHVVLVSDGVESCGGDPCAAAKAMHQAGGNISVHLIGFGVTEAERAELQCIADEGGGIYADANSADELTAALGQVSASVVEDISKPEQAGIAINTSRPNWRLESGGDVYEGVLFKHFHLNGDPMIQLINFDAVNFSMVVDGELSGEQTVANARFVHGRGPVCDRVGPLDMFKIKFQSSQPGWLTGTFSGMLGCPDYSAMPVEGSFHIKAPGE